MKRRCGTQKAYINISYCKEWETYENFYKWAMNNGYDDKMTLDRINPYNNYFPENCRWVTQKVQQNNRTNNHRITYNNETHTIAEWADIKGIPRATISARIYKLNWSEEAAINKPLLRSKK